MTVKPLILALFVSMSMPAFSGQMYEWRDPATGRLMLGDKPPSNVKYWKEGAREPGEKTGTSEAEIEAMRLKNKAIHEAKRSLKCDGDQEVRGIKIGMTEDDVIFCVGYGPGEINTTKGTTYTHEQWVYKESIISYKTVYLYFDNGILKTIQK